MPPVPNAVQQPIFAQDKERLFPLPEHFGLPGGEKSPLHQLRGHLGGARRAGVCRVADPLIATGCFARPPPRLAAHDPPLLRREQIALLQIAEKFVHSRHSKRGGKK